MINNIIQPDLIYIDETLRLVKPDKELWAIALKWYQNEKVMYLSEGITDRVYELDDISRMYRYLSTLGELYFIEIREEDDWLTIGDITLAGSNLPIVIGEEQYWGRGIGRRAVGKLLERAKDIGIEKITIPEIYHYNSRSRNLFVSMGFEKIGETEKAESYELRL